MDDLEHSCVGLSPDTDYRLRLCACNSNGPGSWGDVLHVTTAPPGSGPRTPDTRIPKPWMELQGNMGDIFGILTKKFQVEPQPAWEGLVETWRAHLGYIKLAYRMYCLIENNDPDPKDMGLNRA